MDVPLVVTETSILALTIGGTEFAKRVGLPSAFAPPVALVLGIAFTLGVRMELSVQALLAGVAYAFMSMGLFSATKALARA